MKVIGHRGAAGLELENTMPSIQRALDLAVDAIEFDIQLTSDNEPVICHDTNLKRVGGGNHIIRNLTYSELRNILLRNGSPVPHLREALATAGKAELIIEVKVKDGVKEVLRIVDEFPDANVIIASPVYSEIAYLKQVRPDIKGYIRVVVNPIEAILNARALNADGLDINFWILNPLTYWLAKRENLEIMAYTVDSRSIARFIQALYPAVAICTNHPEWFVARIPKPTDPAKLETKKLQEQKN